MYVCMYVCIYVHDSPIVVQCVQRGIVSGRGPFGEASFPVKHAFIHCSISEHMHRQVLSRSATEERTERSLMHRTYYKVYKELHASLVV